MKYYECDLCGKQIVNKSDMYEFRLKRKSQPGPRGCHDMKREICQDCAFYMRRSFIAAMKNHAELNKNKEDNH